MSDLHLRLRYQLPRLTADNYRETSPASWTYNCVAWAAGVDDAWWWPVVGRYWPDAVPRDETIPAFVAAFTTLGYQTATSIDVEPAVDKIVLYALLDVPTHAARQLSNGWWTSKLGPAVDIEHATPDAVAGGVYGEVVAVLCRKRTPGTTS